jgi:tripartite-type tricarboxylate transporter receptor subunit TctC
MHRAGANAGLADPVTMVVPFAAGGPADTVGRILAPGLSELLGQQIIVENVGGSGGMTGAEGPAQKKILSIDCSPHADQAR